MSQAGSYNNNNNPPITDLLYATYYLSANTAPVTGDNTTYTVVCDTPMSTPTLTGYNTTTGVFTAPDNGIYSFNTCISLSLISSANLNLTATMVCTGTGPDTGNQGYATHVMNAFNMASPGNSDIRYNQSVVFVLNAGDQVYPTTLVSGPSKNVIISKGYGATNVPTTTWITIKKIR